MEDKMVKVQMKCQELDKINKKGRIYTAESVEKDTKKEKVIYYCKNFEIVAVPLLLDLIGYDELYMKIYTDSERNKLVKLSILEPMYIGENKLTNDQIDILMEALVSRYRWEALIESINILGDCNPKMVKLDIRKMKMPDYNLLKDIN